MTETQLRINDAARQEFLEKGYQQASLRNIARRAEVTTGALYGYYDSKENLFESLVRKRYDHVIEYYLKVQREFTQLPFEEQLERIDDVANSSTKEVIGYMYAHMDDFRILLCRAEGTRLAGLLDRIVGIEIESTRNFRKRLKEHGMADEENADPMLEYILTSGMVNAHMEFIKNGIPLERALSCIESMQRFYTGGWKKLLQNTKDE